jgi:uncharacterized protein
MFRVTTQLLSFGDRPRWRTVTGGSARYVSALLGGFAGRLRLHTPVRAVTRAADHVLVTPAGGEAERTAPARPRSPTT